MENKTIPRTKTQNLTELLNNLSTDSTDVEELEQEQESLKETKTYYLFYKELDKKYNICISNLKPREYFACVLCDEDKDFIMEFENHFKYNADYIKVLNRGKYLNYRIHNLTKDKLKQEIDKFIHGLGIGYYLDYFSTVKNWTGKD